MCPGVPIGTKREVAGERKGLYTIKGAVHEFSSSAWADSICKMLKVVCGDLIHASTYFSRKLTSRAR